ncbi:MAG: hypothetical protein WC641_04220 [Patescibacteria group bacterium]
MDASTKSKYEKFTVSCSAGETGKLGYTIVELEFTKTPTGWLVKKSQPRVETPLGLDYIGKTEKLALPDPFHRLIPERLSPATLYIREFLQVLPHLGELRFDAYHLTFYPDAKR